MAEINTNAKNNRIMKAYKGFSRHEDGTLWCRDFQYEVGKTYTFDGEPIVPTWFPRLP